MLIQTPDVIFKKTWQRIPGNIKVTFLSAFLFGVITHFFMMTNTLPNHDDFRNIVGNLEWSLSMNGRWFSPFMASIGGIFTMPWVYGLLAIVFFSISAGFVIAITNVKKYLYCALIAGLMVTIPMVAAFFTYMGVTPVNIGSIMFACLAAFLAVRYKYGFIFATIPIVLSLALYQVSFSITAALLVMALILEVVNNQTTWQKTVIKGIKFVGTLVVGMVMYLLSVRVLFPQGLVGDYQGISQMGQINLPYLPLKIRTAYYEIAKFFLLDSRNYHFSFMNIAFALSFVACAVLVVLLCIRKKLHKEPMKLVLLGLLLLLFPFACNLVFIMGARWIHDLMIYATVFIPIFLLVVVDMYSREPKEDSAELAGKIKPRIMAASISTWIITLTILVSMFNYWVVSNQAYFKLNIGYQVTYAQSILLISHIQNTPGYREDMEIVLVGSKHVPQGMPELHNITIMGANGPELLLDSWAYTYFLRWHLNFTQDITHIRGGTIWVGLYHNNEDIINLVSLVEDLPPYPQDGSIVIIDDVIYVRFAYLDMPSYRPF